nr:hypothetical protein KXZ65_11485 [Pectobacterium sp. PL152]
MSQVEKNINALEIISNKIKSFDSMHDDIKEISLLINELEIIVRKEQSKHYEIFFSDLSLANKIISLCKTGIFNTSTIINSVSVIGNMIKRYGLPQKMIFLFFYDLKHIKSKLLRLFIYYAAPAI